ncbi:MAG TPA: hypothetical protein VGB92_10635 [Longimicrobium sp.]|jgi:hypothetical protein
MINDEMRGWMEILAGAGICLYTASRGARGVFANLRNRGEGLMGAMLIVLGVQTHLDRLNVETTWLRWVPLGLGFLGVALVVAAKAGEPRDASRDGDVDRSEPHTRHEAALRKSGEREIDALRSVSAKKLGRRG